MTDATTPSLRDTLTAAMADTAEPAAVPVEVAAAPVDDAPTAPAEAATPTDTATPVPGAPARDESGRFAPKADGETAPAAPISETAAPADPEPQATPEATRVPPSLSAAVKAQWKELPEEVRKDISKLEESVQTAKAEWGRKGERLNRLEEIIAPHKDAWAVQGLDDHQALTRLVAAEKVLRETPVQGILYLAQAYGVNLQQLVGQGGPGVQAQPAPEEHPGIRALTEQVQTLQATLAQQSQSATEANLASARAQIQEFADNPANLYFENVRDDVHDRLVNGRAQTLAEAYDQAIWASPEIRPHLLKAQTGSAEAAATKKAADDAQRAKAADARKASGSVTGAPTPGAGPAAAAPRANVREELLAAMQEHGVRL